MRHAVAILLAVLVFLAPLRGLRAGAEDLKSGPPPGEAIPGPFHYLNVNGPHASNPHCLVCEFGLRPTVLVFAREVPTDKSPLAILVQKLDEAVGRYKDTEMRGGMIVLNDDFTNNDRRKELIDKLETWAKELKHVLVAVDGPGGPEPYKLSKDAEVTVLLYNKQKVVANFAFAKDKFTEKDLAAIWAAVNKMIGLK